MNLIISNTDLQDDFYLEKFVEAISVVSEAQLYNIAQALEHTPHTAEETFSMITLGATRSDQMLYEALHRQKIKPEKIVLRA